MLSSTSHHLQSFRAGGNLHVDYLLELLQYITNATSQSSRNKKRAASPTPQLTSRPRKRFKKVDATAETKEEPLALPITSVAVFKHVFRLQYSRTEQASPDEDGDAELVAPEDAILEWLKQRQKQNSKRKKGLADNVVECGCVRLAISRTHTVAVADVPSKPGAELFVVPNLDPNFSLDDHDFRQKNLKDPLVAIATLAEAGRAEISAKLRVIVLDDADDSTLPFELELQVDVALSCPSIFEPALYSNKKAAAEVEEAQRRALLHLFTPTSPASAGTNANIPLFYSTLGPAPPTQHEHRHQPSGLRPSLLPFQRRSVAWLLAREHRQIDADGKVVTHSETSSSLFWKPIQIGSDGPWFVNHVTGELRATLPSEPDMLGGILAEEPGLGKTLESIALILLNPSVGRSPSNSTWNPDSRLYVKEIKTTLIVTPNSLAQQWIDELKLHAPSLKVLVYDGWDNVPVPIVESEMAEGNLAIRAKKTVAKKSQKRKGKGSKARDTDEEDENASEWCTWVNTYDVCITTYNVLQHDLGVARPPKERPRRTIATYHEREWYRSPLVMCEWYRVIMDEVQMVGGGQTEEMVSLIPRLSSFAVSGTPARSQVADLIHVLNFLRVNPILKTPKIWPRLLKPGYVEQFKDLFQRCGIRTMKASVKDELTIPKQTRFLVPIELGKVERHVYDQSFERALLDLGFDARGVAVTGNHEVDTGALRTLLRKLRGICTHPQVGQLQNPTDKRKHGGVKTMAEVLEGMKDQNWRDTMEDRKTKIQTLTTNAQLCQRNEKSLQRYQDSLAILLVAEKEANSLISDINAAIDKHNEAGKALIVDLETSSNSSKPQDKGKGRATSSVDDDGLPHTAAAEEHRNKLRAMQARLRECQIAMHRVKFILGDVHHMLGNERLESEAYGAAEELRRILLRSTEEAANHAMNQLKTDTNEKRLSETELVIAVPCCGPGKAKSQDLVQEADSLVTKLLNPQSKLLWKWRTHLINLLSESLTASEEKPDGDEYARTLETQGEAETYLQVYAALLADRKEALIAERTLLAVLDVKEKKERRTRASKKAKAAAAAQRDEDILVMTEDVELRPEDDVLKVQLHGERKALLEEFNPERAVKSIMVDLNNIAARITRDDDPEKKITQDCAKTLRDLIADQGRLMEKLQADLNRLRKAFNERILYFRQLQEISDTVQEVSWEGSTLAEEVKKCKEEAAALDMKINTGNARHRYLEHLAKSKEDGTMDEDEEDTCCILCKCDFTRGFITQCAHVFCEDCIKVWTQRKEGKSCPVCRIAINPDQMQRFVVGQKTEETPARPALNNEPVPKSRRQIEYNLISEGTLDSIQMMESHGSYGSKIETLIKHLLYVQIVEPGAKSIVFSAWADSLKILEHALERNFISFLRIDQGSGKGSAANKFKADPSIHVLLLHGERENAGLNVTCASRVFLVESVVHHAFEIQAIARIDRMGQTRPTEVFCYYAEDTVERHILDLAARRGQSLYTKDNAAGTLTTDTVTSQGESTVDSPKKKRAGVQKGDFVFKTDDMLAIFFPHLFEDIEYLIGSEGVAPGDPPASPSSRRPRQQTNADAGPSRIPMNS